MIWTKNYKFAKKRIPDLQVKDAVKLLNLITCLASLSGLASLFYTHMRQTTCACCWMLWNTVKNHLLSSLILRTATICLEFFEQGEQVVHFKSKGSYLGSRNNDVSSKSTAIHTTKSSPKVIQKKSALMRFGSKKTQTWIFPFINISVTTPGFTELRKAFMFSRTLRSSIGLSLTTFHVFILKNAVSTSWHER